MHARLSRLLGLSLLVGVVHVLASCASGSTEPVSVFNGGGDDASAGSSGDASVVPDVTGPALGLGDGSVAQGDASAGSCVADVCADAPGFCGETASSSRPRRATTATRVRATVARGRVRSSRAGHASSPISRA
jgi:hypothetical protein